MSVQLLGLGGDRAVIVDQPTAVVKPSEHGHG